MIVMLRKATCDLVSPTFRERSDDAYAAWQRKNAPAVDRLRTTSRYRDALEGARAAVARGPTDSEREICSDEFIELLRAEVRPVDPRFASPHQTWQTFVAALRAADRDRALECLTESDAARVQLASRSPEQLRQTGNSFGAVQFDAAPPLAGWRDATVVQTLETGTVIRRHLTFRATANGEWKLLQ